MHLDLSAEQALFRDTTRRFVAATVPLEMHRAGVEDPSNAAFARNWWRDAAELGWTAMLVPEEAGGGSFSGQPVADLAIVAEELGHACAPGPLITTSAVLAGLRESGDHDKEAAAILAGDLVATWAVAEQGRRWAPGEPGMTAEPVEGGYRLDGVKVRVEAADQADVFLVTCRGPRGLTQFLVPATAEGVRVESAASMDLVRRFATVAFVGVRVSGDALVGQPGDAVAAVAAQAAIASVLSCADAAGAAARAFEITLAWAFDRYSFGRPLASYQALKHRFADMATWIEACHATTDAATKALDDRTPDSAELVAVAASYVGATAPTIVQDCIQLHGGIGLTWEHDMHFYLRRVTVDRALYGTPNEHLLDLAALIEL